MNHVRFQPAIILTALVGLLGLEGGAAEASRGAYKLSRPGTCQAVRQQLVDLIVDQVSRYPRNYHYRTPRPRWRSTRMPRSSARAKGPAPTAPAAEGRDDDTAALAGPSHHTTTNNQVVGVDEADRVKTDGRYIYTIAGNEVLIVKSWPPRETSIVARHAVPGGPTQLFLNGNKLVVFSRNYQHSGASRATLLDIQDRANPRLIAHVDIDGQLLRARMIGTDIYMVTNSALRIPPAVWQRINSAVPRRRHRYPGHNHDRMPNVVSTAFIRGEVRRALAQLPVRKLLPMIHFTYGTGTHNSRTSRALLRCGDIYFPAAAQRTTGLVTLSHMSLHGGRVNANAVVGSGMKLFASRRSIYVAAHNYSSGYQDAHIHKFFLNGNNGPRYAASGVVPGQLLNQFSMDEHRGYLRVATTDNSSRSWRWRGQLRTGIGNNLFVLQQRQGELAIVGQIRGLAPGERIYAARMMGDEGYLVTFRRTDPLYTIDLSNPRQPRVMGELKIPGFSSYIHPIGNGQLLTVGQNADDNGRVRGVHLQIFDVRNLRSPRRTHHFELTPGFGSSRSVAQQDHHAFTYNPRNRVLAMPLTVYRYHQNGGNFNGVILVKVDPSKGFSHLGGVEHADLAQQTRCAASNSYCGNTANFWNTPVNRSIFMDDTLYTLSAYGIKVNKVNSTLSPLASMIFARTNNAFVR